jgi:5,10-methylene-tetrahydrofolate dehydrogenase/methenyl tetrahydrofolate cyclohydrolase
MIALSLLLMLVVFAESAPILVQTPFVTLKDEAKPKIAVFYRSSDPESKSYLRVAAKAARVSFSKICDLL